MSNLVSFVVLTLNERSNLRGCIESIRGFSDDVSVLDSGSTDGTCEEAEKLGVKLFSNRFTGFGDQRNWAIDNIPTTCPWTFHLDADERLTPELKDEITAEICQFPTHAGYYILNKLMMGKSWLKYSSDYPVPQVRLFHRDRLRFANHGHGQRVVTNGTLGYLKHHYLHFAFSKGLQHWLVKHVEYARQEAILANASQSTSMLRAISTAVRSRSQEKRLALKRLSFRVPFRPILRFAYHYAMRRGFLDGTAGFQFARMMATYECMISLFLNDCTKPTPTTESSPTEG